MRKFFAVALVLALPLGGCTTVGAVLSGSVANPISPTTVYELRAGYDAAFLVPATAYRRLYDSDPCAAGEHASASHICGEAAIVQRLQSADLAAEGALDAAESFVRQHPTLDASAVIAVAQAAISAAENIAASNNVH